MRVFNQPAYTLLSRPYSESSSIVEVFTLDYGRLGLMAKGAKRLKSKLKGVLLPFQPILVSWTGKGDVPTLTGAEVDLSEFSLTQHDLRGDALVCGFYCNELLINLLHRHDPHKQLFGTYHDTILTLNDGTSDYLLSDKLRAFEQAVMKETGYEVSFLVEADGKTVIEDNAHYQFQTGYGFVRVDKPNSSSSLGAIIKSLHGAGTTQVDPLTASHAKLLMRKILSQTLAHKKIVSRDLFFPRIPSV